MENTVESENPNGSASSVIHFPPEVDRAIQEVFPSDDPLDKPDFEPVDYINGLFPTEQSLTNLDDVIGNMKYNVQAIDDDIRKIVRNQTNSGQDASAALEEAQGAIVQLFTQIRDIKQKAGESEAMVRDITRDIKQLDTAKRNLSSAITTLNHLHMLVSGITKLQENTKDRQYEDASNLLKGLISVLNHFRNYKDIPQIKELSDQYNDVQKELSEQILNDFQAALNTEGFQPTRQLAGACLVLDVLPDTKAKKSLIKWIVSTEMGDYSVIFTEHSENSWLDKVESRFNWLKSRLVDFENRLGPLFPSTWEMSERMAIEFCDQTRRHLEKIMFKRKLEMDTKLLLHAIQRTHNFESLLNRRFEDFSGKPLKEYKEERLKKAKNEADGNNPFEEAIDDPNNPFFDPDVQDSKEVKKVSSAEPDPSSFAPFTGLISKCFEDYLGIYVENQERSLAELVERAAVEQKARGSANLATEGSAVLHSSGDLFMFYKKSMMQCVQLSTGEPLLALTNVFKKYLREYATKVMISNMPKSNSAPNSSALTASMPSIKELKDLPNIMQTQFQSLLKEGDSLRLTDDEKVLICTFLVTSEYCLETAQQLETKLKEKIDPDLVAQINMAQEQDVYNTVINNCIQLLVKELETACDTPLSMMLKVGWSRLDRVGDSSDYVNVLTNLMRQNIPLIRDNLANSKKYFTSFCIKFVTSFIAKFTQNVYKCKPIVKVGAEQLLLDAHAIKTLLLDLPSVGRTVTAPGAAPNRKAPANYTKLVIKGMTRTEMMIKVLMSPADNVEHYVEHCLKLVPDIDSVEFAKLLDLHGVRKVDQTAFMDFFNTTAPQNTSTILSPSSNTSKLKKLESKVRAFK